MTVSPEATGSPIHLENATKIYEDVVALNDVTLDVRAGEFLTLLGPSGSGKTTTLNAIAGFVNLTRGRVSIAGDDVTSVPPQRRNLGVVFQHYALFPHMSVFDNVAFPLRRRRIPKNEVRRLVSEALELVRMDTLTNRYPSQLSGGQQQRVALARAIVYKPAALLLDEPLGALDRKLRESLQLEIRHLHRESGITFVFVTHDQEEALTLSDRVAVFREGEIDQIGTPEELYREPRTEFVGRFVGESTMVPGEVSSNGRAVMVRGMEIPAPKGGGMAPGQRAFALLRPDHVAIDRVDSPSSGTEPAYSVAGFVVDRIFLGESERIVVSGDDGIRYIVRRSAQSVGGLVENERVTVRWKLADAVVVPRDGSPQEQRREVSSDHRV